MLANRMNNLKPYVPGEQPKDREYIKINANENPYPPSPKVKEAVVDFVENNLENYNEHGVEHCLKYGNKNHVRSAVDLAHKP